jgi:DNA end-binding protein Ku
MKKIWSGSLSFSLVTIPVEMYSAVKEHLLGFKLLCGRCKTPITYQRFCEHCKKPIPWADVVKGLKLENGSYFILTPEKIKELKPEKTDAITIIEFVAEDAVNIIYFEQHYYLAPDKKGHAPFRLFCEALFATKKAAIGTFVMRDKEYVCMLSPYENGLLLTTLNYAYEIVPTKEIFKSVATKKPSSAELKLAAQLIAKHTVKKFDISDFKDTFAEKLKKAIRQQRHAKSSKKKTHKKEVVMPKKATLIGALRESIRRPKISHGHAIHAKKRRRS